MTESEERVDDDSVDKVVEEKVEDKVDEPVTPHKAASEVSPATPVTPVTPISPTRSKRKAVPSIDSVSVYESSPGASSLQLSEVPPLREAAEVGVSRDSTNNRLRIHPRLRPADPARQLSKLASTLATVPCLLHSVMRRIVPLHHSSTRCDNSSSSFQNRLSSSTPSSSRPSPNMRTLRIRSSLSSMRRN